MFSGEELLPEIKQYFESQIIIEKDGGGGLCKPSIFIHLLNDLDCSLGSKEASFIISTASKTEMSAFK